MTRSYWVLGSAQFKMNSWLHGIANPDKVSFLGICQIYHVIIHFLSEFNGESNKTIFNANRGQENAQSFN